MFSNDLAALSTLIDESEKLAQERDPDVSDNN